MILMHKQRSHTSGTSHVGGAENRVRERHAIVDSRCSFFDWPSADYLIKTNDSFAAKHLNPEDRPARPGDSQTTRRYTPHWPNPIIHWDQIVGGPSKHGQQTDKRELRK